MTVLDAQNAGADGCEHHGARLLASLEGGRVYALPDAPAGAAIRVFQAAAGIRPFPWMAEAPRTEPSQLSLAENRGSQLPVYGPTEPLGDEEHTPEVTVRVDFLMSREQIMTALGIAWAEGFTTSPVEGLTVLQVRHEVEAYLSVQAFHALDVQMERDRGRTFPPEQQRVMQLLAEAVDRAYPAASTMVERPVQQPRYGDGTVTLTTLDHGEITIDEPRWCTGHDGEQIVQRVDVTHVGRTVTAAVETDGGTGEFLPARLAWAPFAERQPELLADVDEFPGMDPAQLRELAAEVALHAGRLYRLSNELDRLRRDGQ